MMARIKWVIWLGWTILVGVMLHVSSGQSLANPKGLTKPRISRQLTMQFTKGNLTLQYTDEGGFTLRRFVDGKWLLYPGNTSYISVNVDGNVYVQPHMGIATHLEFVGKTDTSDGPVFTYNVPDIPIQVKIAFFIQNDVMFIRTEVINKDSRNHTIAVRYLLDTQLDENDGAPLFAPSVVDPITGQTVVTHEVTVTNPSFGIWKAFDRPDNPTFTTIGTLTQLPVRIAFAHWPEAVHEPWDYTTDPNRRFFTPGFNISPESDSCVLIWFEQRILAPSSQTMYETGYGLREAVTPQVSEREQLILALQELQKAIDLANQKWAEVAGRIAGETRDTIGEATFKALIEATISGFTGVTSLVIGQATSDITRLLSPDEISYLGDYGRTVKAILMLYNLLSTGRELLNFFLNRFPNAMEVKELLLNKTSDDVNEAKQALQEIIDTLPNPLPPGFNTNTILSILKGQSGRKGIIEIVKQSANNQLTDYTPILLPNNTILIIPQGRVYSRAVLHSQLKELFGEVETLSDITWAIGVGAGIIGIIGTIAVFTGGAPAILVGGLTIASTGLDVAKLFTISPSRTKVRTLLFTNMNDACVDVMVDTILLKKLVLNFTKWIKTQNNISSRQGATGTGKIILNSLTLTPLSITSGSILSGEAMATIKNIGDGIDSCIVVLNFYWQFSQSNQPYLISAAISEVVSLSAGELRTVHIPIQVPPVWGNAPGRVKVVANLVTASGFGSSPLTVEIITSPTGASQIPLPFPESTPVISGTIMEGGIRETNFSVSIDEENVQFILTYDIGELDLHIYDSQGRHVGVNYQTGETELQIPGAAYTGSASYPEIITIPNAGGQTFTVRVISIFGPSRLSRATGRQQVSNQDVSTFSVTAITRSISPALISVVPSSIPIVVEPTQTTASGEFRIVELGGDIGIKNITATVTDLTSQEGQTISAGAIVVSVDNSNIGAGQSTVGRVSITLPPNIPDGVYEGTIRITGQDEGSGVNLLVDVPIHLLRMRIGEVRISRGLSIVALPFTPTNREVELVLGELATNNLVARYDLLSRRYVYSTEPDFGEIAVGKAVWVKSSNDLNYVLPGFAAANTVISLKPGWNLIGNLFPQAVDWSLSQMRVRRGTETMGLEQAQQAGWIEDYAWGWRQDENDPSKGRYVLVYDPTVIPGVQGQLEPWKGYWVYAYTDCELILPPPGRGQTARSRQQPAERKGWTITLKARAGEGIGEVMLGAIPGSRSLAIGLPPDPPTAGQPLRVVARKDGLPLAVDVRTEGRANKPWDIEVQVPAGENDTATLWWQDVHRAPRQVNPVLVDLQTGERKFLRTTSSHTFAVSRQGGVYRFRIELLPQGQLLRISQVRVSGGRSRGAYTISFGVNAGAQLEVHVLSAGKTVRRLASTVTRSAGTHQVVWDGRDDNGVALPAGAYLVEIKAVSTDGQVVRATTPVVLTR